MSFRKLLIHTVTIYNTAKVAEDRYGNPVKEPDGGTVEPARVDALSTGGAARELLVGRDTRQTWFLVFLLPGSVVDGTSVIEWNGRRLSVDGEPSMQYDSKGEHHIECAAKEVRG